MALTIEDGTIVVGADSFATVDECRAYCDPRGLDLPALDADVEPLLINAADFLFSIEHQFNGVRFDATQVLPFPRDVIYLYGEDISGTIPNILKQAQSRLAFDSQSSELLPTGTGREVIEEGVGPLRVKYGQDGNTTTRSAFTAAMTILQPLFLAGHTGSGGQFNIPVSR